MATFVKGEYFAWDDELRRASGPCEIAGGPAGSVLRGGADRILVFGEDCTRSQAIKVCRAFKANRDYLDLQGIMR